MESVVGTLVRELDMAGVRIDNWLFTRSASRSPTNSYPVYAVVHEEEAVCLDRPSGRTRHRLARHWDKAGLSPHSKRIAPL